MFSSLKSRVGMAVEGLHGHWARNTVDVWAT